MPNRCVRCGKIYQNAASEILTGCTCGSHYFFFFKEDDLNLLEQTDALTNQERDEILEDVRGIVGEEPDKPVILNLESIRIKKPGKFEIDLVSLFKGEPVIYKLEDGKYIIDLASTFMMSKHKVGPERVPIPDQELIKQVKKEQEKPSSEIDFEDIGDITKSEKGDKEKKGSKGE